MNDYEKLDFNATLDDFAEGRFLSNEEKNHKSILKNIISRAVNNCYDRKSDFIFSTGDKIRMTEFTHIVVTDDELRKKTNEIIKQNLTENGECSTDDLNGMLVDMIV